MKNYGLKYAALCLLFMGFCRCGYLDEIPQTQYSTEQIYSTEAGVRSVLYDCYASMANPNGNRSGNLYELGANSFALQSRAGAATWRVGIVGLTPSNDPTYVTPVYKGIYQVIMTANDIIQNVHYCNTTEQKRLELESEAKFLRAVSYFDLVRLFGRVPLVMRNDADYPDQPRAAVRDVYTQIIADLEDAFDMPEKGDQLPGQPHRWASKAYLAKVYVTMAGMTADHFNTAKGEVPYTPAEQAGFWQQAYNYAKEVVDEGAYELTPTYAEMWNNVRNNTEESILELQHANGNGTLSWQVVRTLGPGHNNICYYSPLVTSSNSTWGRITIHKWVFAEHWLKYGNPAKSLKQVNTNRETDCDPRINVNYLYYNDRYPEATGITQAPFAIWPNTNINVGDGAQQGSWNYIKKYWYYNWTGQQTGSTNNIIYRYADLLLLMAEAANELGHGDDEVVGLVNQVLGRARHTSSGDTAQPTDWSTGTMSQDDLRWAIMRERIYELLGEGHEMFDARRRGAPYMRKLIYEVNFWVDRCKKPVADIVDGIPGWNKPITNSLYEYLEYTYPENDPEFMHKVVYFPFPKTELQKNEAMQTDDQNYGWPL